MNKDLDRDGVQNALTGIHTRIHSVAATDEVGQAQIEAFLDTLADVAMQIAKGRAEGQDEPM